MDFVVIGLGLGALALLAGLALLCLTAPRWARRAAAATHPADATYARAVGAERQATGQSLLAVGGVLLLTTVGGVSAGVDDKAGAFLLSSVATVAALGLIGWDALYRRQHPRPPQRRPAPPPASREAAAPLPLPAQHAAASTTTVTTVRRRVLPARQRPGAAPPPVERPEAPAAADRSPDGTPAPATAPAGATADEAAPAEATGPKDAAEAAPELGDDAPHPPDTEPAPPDDAPEPPDETARRPATVAAATGAEPADPASAPTSLPDSEALPHGDDKVIALFPTAAARRRPTSVTPTGPDDKR
ncbi:MAG: hypothetical protein KC442_06080 [Thermomicrobiales bacterium]|nr:hypothetical protein [Thermomicrobiales bacterium]